MKKTSKKKKETIITVEFGYNLVWLSYTYSGLHKNWPFAYFEKITVSVGWVYIKDWPITHLKALTPTFQLT